MKTIRFRVPAMLGVLGVLALAGTSCQKADPPAAGRPANDHNGLTEADRDVFYHLPEGGDFIPYKMFLSLEQPATTQLFRNNLERFGLLPDTATKLNPDGLPVGLVTEEAPDVKIRMVGVNCSACHVGEFSYKNQVWRVDGAPNSFDFVGYNLELGNSMLATIKSPAKLFRFVLRFFTPDTKVGALFHEFESYEQLKGSDGAEEELFDELADSGAKATQKIEEEVAKGGADAAEEILVKESEPRLKSKAPRLVPLIKAAPAKNHYLARMEKAEDREKAMGDCVDEFVTHIRLMAARAKFMMRMNSMNKIPMTVPGPGRFDAFGFARALSFTNADFRPMNAPVDYPHLWGNQKTAWLNWNGCTSSVMARNVIILDAIVDKNYDSTLLFENIHQLEEMSYRIRAPHWPSIFPAIDAARAMRGKAIYDGEGDYKAVAKGNCASCHNQANPAEIDPNLIDYPLYSPEELGTDPNHAVNFDAALADGTAYPAGIKSHSGKIEQRYYEVHNISPEVQKSKFEDNRTASEWRSTRKYVARPLDGIWASPPYLHNGSVPSLADLLNPSAQRPRKFPVGHREYDPARVGLTLAASMPPAMFDVDQRVTDNEGNTYPLTNGNSNAGHEYGTGLTAEEKLDLLEYLKTL